MSIIRFEDVDVIFSKDPRAALKLLDEGMTRNEILKKPGKSSVSKKPAWTSRKARSAY